MSVPLLVRHAVPLPRHAPGTAPPILLACQELECKASVLTRPLHFPPPRLAGLLGAWAVHHRPGGSSANGGPDEGAEGYHAYLLLSFPGATKVLATGDELREVTETWVLGGGVVGRVGID